MKNTNILALVPARLGSKGMPRKNLTMVGGKPLYAWAVEQGRRAVGNVILSTDIEEIREHEEYIRSEEILWRPSALASDSSTMNDVVRHTIDSLRLDSSQIIVLLQPTSPLRTVEDINSALAIFRKDEAEVVLSVVKEKNEAMKWGVMDAEKFVPLAPEYCFSNRQQLPQMYKPNGAVYVFSVRTFNKNNGIGSDNISCFEMPAERSVDLDDFDDFLRIEALFPDTLNSVS